MGKSQKMVIFLVLSLTIFSIAQTTSLAVNNRIYLPSFSSTDGVKFESNLTGIIVLWNGNLSSIPDGWALCDGENGTPNLEDRFVMSVGEFENPGQIGGSMNHTHTYEELPYHDHAISDPGHSHYIYEKDGSEGALAASGSYVYSYDYNSEDMTSGYKINFNPNPTGIENCETDESCILPSFIKLSYMIKTDHSQEVVLPANSILGWVDAYENIPAGWVLCDGSLSAPNLTNRFIYSTTEKADLGQTGGSITHNHSYSDIPLHDHSVDIDSHDHSHDIPKASTGVSSGTDVNTLDDLTYNYLTESSSLSGITIQYTGYTDCETWESDSFPPYFKMSFITTNLSSASIPNRSIFWWGSNMAEIPQNTFQYVGLTNSKVYNRFLLSTTNEFNIGDIGGFASHSHKYTKIPRHTHTYTETAHYHSYKRVSYTLHGVSTASPHSWVSNPSYPLTQTSVSGSNVNIIPLGKTNCYTENSSSLPPYYKLGLIQAAENLVQIQPSRTIEFQWYWWMIIGSASTVVMVATIEILIRRKQRKNTPSSKK